MSFYLQPNKVLCLKIKFQHQYALLVQSTVQCSIQSHPRFMYIIQNSVDISTSNSYSKQMSIASNCGTKSQVDLRMS